MTDELDRLRTALKAAPPAADPEAKAQALRLALENFDRHQGTAASLRPTSDRPLRAGVLTGVRRMLTHLSPRAVLGATASFAVIACAIALYPELRPAPGLPPAVIGGTEPAPAQPKTAPGTGPVAAPARPPVAAPTVPPAPAAEPSPKLRKSDAEEAPLTDAPAPATTAETSTLEGAIAESVQQAVENTPPPPSAGLAAPREADALAAGAADARASGAQQGLPVEASAPFPSDPATLSPQPNTEAFANAAANPVKIAAEEPVSTFSIDTDTASWPVVRASLAAGALPPAEAIRVEEMVNYFPYAYPAPEPGEAPFRASVSLFPTPWNKGTELLRIGLQGALPAIADRPALDLVFLIDTSGSMEDANKLPLLKQSLRLMLGQLRPEDRVAIVTYAGSAGLVLDPTATNDRSAILAALDRLGAGGSTAGAEGLELAYQVAEGMKGEGRVGRVLLATDGDFNVGLSDPSALEDFIATKRKSGTYLSVLGFGRGNLDDAVMQALAQNGNGTAAYIDTAAEAQKVLVDQLTGALFPIADDVKVQVEFNPAVVAEYRLIGYETRALAREDFNNDRVDAGEIGAGHQVTALYEITPVGSPARRSDPLRYGAAPADAADGTAAEGAELGFLKLRWKAPGATVSELVETPIPATPTEADADARFAAAIAGMGQLLGAPKYLGDWGWDEAIALASGAKGEDRFGYRAEAVTLMRLAQSLAR